MKPFTAFTDSESGYIAIAELLLSWPECKVFDDGEWRIVRIPSQPNAATMPLTEDTYIIQENWAGAFDDLSTSFQWLSVSQDGEHPDGYATELEACEAMKREQEKVAAWVAA